MGTVLLIGLFVVALVAVVAAFVASIRADRRKFERERESYALKYTVKAPNDGEENALETAIVGIAASGLWR